MVQKILYKDSQKKKKLLMKLTFDKFKDIPDMNK